MVEFRYSGGVNNVLAVASLGGEMSNTPITSDDLNNIFDTITRVEAINKKIDYRMVWLLNTDVENYISSFIKDFVFSENSEISIAIDNSINPQLLMSEDETPTDLTFYMLGEWAELSLVFKQFNSGVAVPIWFKRSVIESTGLDETINLNIDAVENLYAPTQDFAILSNNGMNTKFQEVPDAAFNVGSAFVGKALMS
jgi:hypothetical protein